MLFKSMFQIILAVFLIAELTSGQSLNQAVELALQYNKSIKAAEEQYNSASETSRSVYRNTLPAVNFAAFYSHITDVAQISFPAMGNAPGRTIQAGVYDSYETDLNLQYAVFTGYANQAKIEMSDNQQLMSKNALNKTQKEIAFAVISAYRQTQALDLDIMAMKAALKRSELQKKRLISLYENGMILPLDTLSITLAVLNYKEKIITMNAFRDNFLDYLEILTGKHISIMAFDNQDLSKIVPKLQLEENEDLKILKINTELIANKQKLIKSGFYPKIHFQATVKYAKPGIDMFANDWMTYGVIGLGLKWDIFNWGSDKFALSAEKANYRRNSYHIEVKRDHLQMDYDRVQRELNSLQKKSEVLRAAWSVADQKMRTFQQQSENGVVSSSEFNEANQELTQAEMSYRQQLVLIAQKHNEIEYKSGKKISEWRL